MTIGFVTAIALRPRSRLARVVAEPWLITGLLVAAAVCGAAGEQLWLHGIGGAPLVGLAGVVPELACLAIVGRLIAALLSPDA
jgi:hypothetical protein